MTAVVETGRLRLRVPRAEDDAFFLALLNDPDWHRFVNDPGVRDQAGAREWVESRLLKLQAEHGFTLFLVERREDAVPLGICGLVKRESLEHPDLGFGFLPVGRGQGYAEEAARAAAFVHAQLEHRRPFVRAWAFHALHHLAGQHPSYRADFEQRRAAAEEGESASVKARLRNLKPWA